MKQIKILIILSLLLASNLSTKAQIEAEGYWMFFLEDNVKLVKVATRVYSYGVENNRDYITKKGIVPQCDIRVYKDNDKNILLIKVPKYAKKDFGSGKFAINIDETKEHISIGIPLCILGYSTRSDVFFRLSAKSNNIFVPSKKLWSKGKSFSKLTKEEKKKLFD